MESDLIKREYPIVLPDILEEPLKSFFLKKEILVHKSSNDGWFEALLTNVTLKDLCEFGIACLVNTWYWNWKIDKQIERRSSSNISSNPKKFAGTQEELKLLNAKDDAAKINFPEHFFEDIILKIRAQNPKDEVLNIEASFVIMLNYDRINIDIEKHVNSVYGSDFKIIEIVLYDTMYFAKIQVIHFRPIDVVCLGYLIAYSDEKHGEFIRKQNASQR